MNSSRSLLSSPLFASSSPSPSLRSSSTIPIPSTPSRTSVPMIHDGTGSRASTSCYYSPPSIVVEEQQQQLHGSSSTLKGERALLELLLDMALDQHVDQEAVDEQDRDFETYLREATSRVLCQPPLQPARVIDRSVLADSEEDGASASCSTSSGSLVASPASQSSHQLHRVEADEEEELPSDGQVLVVRSTRLAERRSKKRRAPFRPSSKDTTTLVSSKKRDKPSNNRYGRGALDADEPFRLFLRDRETTEFLTAKEEKHLFSQIKHLMELEEARCRLQGQCGREPSVAEWAQAVGMSCRELQSCVRAGRRCREKMARSNFRLVIHVARRYEGCGLDIQELVQDGCCGLMKTFEKFNPSKGCRFPTYAYWWIRQAIKKSISKNSRLIRLPESVLALQRKVGKAKMECIAEGEQATSERVAMRAGITVEKLARLRAKTRKPLSMQDRVWSGDDGVTFQEITEDPNVEPPELCVERLMMRQQVREFLGILSPREREIIELRFGIHDGEPKTLHVIGDMYGLSKERIRQVQNRALDKLKKSVAPQGFDAYFDLIC